jgi:pimeloyl-ACP methyl ester carboxylesterase
MSTVPGTRSGTTWARIPTPQEVPVSTTDQQSGQAGAMPTIVLVHGAFADASSWNGVVGRLQQQAAPSSPRRTRCAA